MRGDGNVRGSGRCKRQAVCEERAYAITTKSNFSWPERAKAVYPGYVGSLPPVRTRTLESLELHCLRCNTVPYGCVYSIPQWLALAMGRDAVALRTFRSTRCGLRAPHNPSLGSRISTASTQSWGHCALNTPMPISGGISQCAD
ncbi:hypothetical protein PMIN01_06582 [Paraphaeosphaeria minitans]|uniref:Uncharacterized protein n=1 Tax=Paraphaeosphaeria minitans TaxID=565426 RepID=A0A9P6GGH8_9PLEO|nr:hypothetical protein PMIN01_06582 [Paraphaeosphaeria minitans]